MKQVNRRTKMIITRLLTAVFLFVIISTTIYPALPALASDVSGNDAEETEFDYDNWEDALADQDFVDAMADKISNYFTALYTSYTDATGDRWDQISDVVDPNGTAQYYYDKYNHIVDYLNPFVNTYIVNDFQPGINVSPKQISSNDPSVLTDIVKDFGDNLSDLLPGSDSVFTDLPSKVKSDGTLIHYDIFPDSFYFTTIQRSFLVNQNNFQFNGTPMYTYYGDYYYQEKNCTLTRCIQDKSNSPQFSVITISGEFDGNVRFAYKSNGQLYYRDNWNDAYFFCQLTRQSHSQMYFSKDTYTRNYGYTNGNFGAVDYSKDHKVAFYGDAYIYDGRNNSDTYKNLYFWDSSERELYLIGYNLDIDNTIKNYTDGSGTSVTYNNTTNIYNSVDFDTYNDYITDLLVEVTQGYTVNNQLLIELLKTISQQNNNYVQNDDDTIDDFLDDLKNRLQDTIEVNLTIPDITPDLSGIANALAALLNFLASIIRAIGDIVSSLLDGLFHLIVPSDDDWLEINVEFNNLTAPVNWIKDFVGEGSRAVSLCLFGSNVTDFPDDAEEESEVVNASVNTTRSGQSEHSDSHHANIEYNDNGAPKIPVHFSNSTSEYFSNIGDAYIIDLSWYAPFKPIGDVIVVAFCWIAFIWRTLLKLPGILSGSSASSKESEGE